MTMPPVVERIAHGTPAYRHMAFTLLLAGFSTFAQLDDVLPLLSLFAHRLRSARPMRVCRCSFPLARWQASALHLFCQYLGSSILRDPSAAVRPTTNN